MAEELLEIAQDYAAVVQEKESLQRANAAKYGVVRGLLQRNAELDAALSAEEQQAELLLPAIASAQRQREGHEGLEARIRALECAADQIAQRLADAEGRTRELAAVLEHRRAQAGQAPRWREMALHARRQLAEAVGDAAQAQPPLAPLRESLCAAAAEPEPPTRRSLRDLSYDLDNLSSPDDGPGPPGSGGL
jgi:hypothetical protein